MPGRDGTGPMERGSLTGRGFGFCSVGNTFRSGAGLGFGRGLGLGCRRGFGRYLSIDPEIASKTQKEFLTEQKELLEDRLNLISKRLEDL
jgi:hypothetical protein